MGVFEVLDMVREGTWRAGGEGKNKRIDQVMSDMSDAIKYVQRFRTTLFYEEKD